MNTDAFTNVKDQIGACGIWCGSCAVGNGSLRLASHLIVEVLEGHGIEHWAPPALDYAALRENLRIVSDIAICAGCRQAGGRENCELRACASRHKLADCAACQQDCRHSNLLDHMRTGALNAGLIVDTQPSTASLREQQMSTLSNRFPACLLFLRET